MSGYRVAVVGATGAVGTVMLQKLRERGFPAEVVRAVDHLTRREGESYEDFVRRAAGHPVARRVKIADLEDNMDVRRLATVGPKEADRLSRYVKAYARLKAP